jgi:hypothetical protein
MVTFIVLIINYKFQKIKICICDRRNVSFNLSVWEDTIIQCPIPVATHEHFASLVKKLQPGTPQCQGFQDLPRHTQPGEVHFASFIV